MLPVKISLPNSNHKAFIPKIKYWNASGSGFPPSLIPALQIIDILHHKKAKLPKHLQQSVCKSCLHASLVWVLIFFNMPYNANKTIQKSAGSKHLWNVQQKLNHLCTIWLSLISNRLSIFNVKNDLNSIFPIFEDLFDSCWKMNQKIFF